MSTDNKNGLLYTEEQFAEWERNLSEADRAEAVRLQMTNRLVNPQQPKQIDWSSLGSGDFDRESTKLFAEYERKKAQQGE